MKSTLENIIERLKKVDYKNEEHVRLSLVLRILFELGWDIWNPQEVNSEFVVVPHEDSTRVDLALFLQPYRKPTIFIEIKSVGKLLQNLSNIEIQVRDYNRNNTAPIAILTDGRYWRFYLSIAVGEFSSKCFEKIDLLDENKSIDDLQLIFDSFLSKEALETDRAIEDAKIYHRRTEEERFMIEALPAARKDAEDDPITSLVDCFIKKCSDYGFDISKDEATVFIKNQKSSNLNYRDSAIKDKQLTKPLIEIQQKTIIPKSQNGTQKFKTLKNRQGVNSKGYENPDGKFTVLEGSVATLEPKKLGESNLRIRTDLIKSGILQKVDSGYKLSQDYKFNSSSQAASIFLGCSASGPREWT